MFRGVVTSRLNSCPDISNTQEEGGGKIISAASVFTHNRASGNRAEMLMGRSSSPSVSSLSREPASDRRPCTRPAVRVQKLSLERKLCSWGTRRARNSSSGEARIFARLWRRRSPSADLARFGWAFEGALYYTASGSTSSSKRQSRECKMGESPREAGPSIPSSLAESAESREALSLSTCVCVSPRLTHLQASHEGT